MDRPVSRRRLLGAAGAAAGGMVVGGMVGPPSLAAVTQERRWSSMVGVEGDGSLTFHGERQTGVDTPAQAHVVVVGVDVAGGVAELRAVLDSWSVAVPRLMAGAQVGERSPSSRLPSVDTGEADDRRGARLGITVAVTTGAFGDDRLGLGERRPSALVEPPPLAGDDMDPRWRGGDLALVVGSDDLQAALHAVRNLVRVADGRVSLRWTHTGFGPPVGAGPVGDGTSSHRDLLGFREGTGAPRPGSSGHADAVWVTAADGPSWMVGGTYLVLRRVVLDLTAWEALTLLDRERVIGRHRRSGAPLGEIDEAAPLALEAEGLDGLPLTDPRSHVAVAHRASVGRRPLARRSYNLADGVPQAGGADSGGLLFLAHCRDPLTQYLPVLEAVANEDLLATYARTVASQVAAVLPGLGAGESWSERLWD